MDKQKVDTSVAAYCAGLSANDGFEGFDIFDINAIGRNQRVCGYDGVALFALVQD